MRTNFSFKNSLIKKEDNYFLNTIQILYSKCFVNDAFDLAFLNLADGIISTKTLLNIKSA